MCRYGSILALSFLAVATNGWCAAAGDSLARSEFNLPAQPLLQAIQAVARQSDINIIVDPSLVAGRWAPAIAAHLTMQEAIAKLLAGTGLTQRVVDDKTIAIMEE